MQEVSVKLLKNGVPYNGNIVVTDNSGNPMAFRSREGWADRGYSIEAQPILDGNVNIAVLGSGDVVVKSEDGSVSSFIVSGVAKTGPVPSTGAGIVTVDEGWEGDVYATIANELLILRGSLTAGSGAGSSILHVPAGYAAKGEGWKATISLNDLIVGVNSNTTGYLRLSTDPTEGDIVAFPGTVI